MSESEHLDHVAHVSVDDRALMGEVIDRSILRMRFEETLDMFGKPHKVLLQVARLMEPAEMVQRVCNHPKQILSLQKEITDLTAQHFRHPTCDHSGMDWWIGGLEYDLAQDRRGPAVEDSSDEVHTDPAAMTQDARKSREEVQTLWTQLVNALTLASRVAPAAPQGQEDKSQKFRHSTGFSHSAQTQLGGLNTQLRMVTHPKPGSFPEEQTKMRYAFDLFKGTALEQILSHSRDDGTIGLGDLTAFIQLLEAAFGDHDRAATEKRIVQENKPMNQEFSQN